MALFNEQFHYYIFAQSVFLKQARVEKKKRCLLSTFKISIEDHVLFCILPIYMTNFAKLASIPCSEAIT